MRDTISVLRTGLSFLGSVVAISPQATYPASWRRYSEGCEQSKILQYILQINNITCYKFTVEQYFNINWISDNFQDLRDFNKI